MMILPGSSVSSSSSSSIVDLKVWQWQVTQAHKTGRTPPPPPSHHSLGNDEPLIAASADSGYEYDNTDNDHSRPTWTGDDL